MEIIEHIYHVFANILEYNVAAMFTIYMVLLKKSVILVSLSPLPIQSSNNQIYWARFPGPYGPLFVAVEKYIILW